MKLTTSLIALCLVASAPLAAAQTASPASQVKNPSASERLDFALVRAKHLATVGQATSQDFQTVDLVLSEWIQDGPTPFDPEQLRKSLQEMIGNLTSQAASAYQVQVEFARLQESIVEAKLDRMIFELEVRMKEGGGTRKQFDRIQELLHQRADSMMNSPSAEPMRQRLQAAIAQLHERARAAADGRADTDDVHRAIFAARAQRALERLEVLIAEGKASSADYIEWVLKTTKEAAELEERLKLN